MESHGESWRVIVMACSFSRAMDVACYFSRAMAIACSLSIAAPQPSEGGRSSLAASVKAVRLEGTGSNGQG